MTAIDVRCKRWSLIVLVSNFVRSSGSLHRSMHQLCSCPLQGLLLLQDLGDKAKDAYKDAKSAVKDAAGSVKEGAKDAKDNVKGGAKDA